MEEDKDIEIPSKDCPSMQLRRFMPGLYEQSPYLLTLGREEALKTFVLSLPEKPKHE